MYKKNIAPFLSTSKHMAKIKIIQKNKTENPKPPNKQTKDRLREGKSDYFLDVFLQDQPSQRPPDLFQGDGGEMWPKPPCPHAAPSNSACPGVWELPVPRDVRWPWASPAAQGVVTRERVCGLGPLADSSTAFSTAASHSPTRKNRLLSWQGNIIRVLQAGRLRRRVYFCVTHSGWPGSLWWMRKFNVSQSPGPVLSLPVLCSLWVHTMYLPGMLFSLGICCWHPSAVSPGSVEGAALCQKGEWGAADFGE